MTVTDTDTYSYPKKFQPKNLTFIPNVFTHRAALLPKQVSTLFSSSQKIYHFSSLLHTLIHVTTHKYYIFLQTVNRRSQQTVSVLALPQALHNS